jgi:ATP-dependent DNA helicase MPH1
VDVEISGTDSADEPSQDEETESDRKFAGKDFAPTQAPKGYNQRAIYLAGLSTQAGSRAGLGFNPRGNPEGFLAKARRPVLVTDDERSEGAATEQGADSENEYELGSFVVQDDEDLGFDACE